MYLKYNEKKLSQQITNISKYPELQTALRENNIIFKVAIGSLRLDEHTLSRHLLEVWGDQEIFKDKNLEIINWK